MFRKKEVSETPAFLFFDSNRAMNVDAQPHAVNGSLLADSHELAHHAFWPEGMDHYSSSCMNLRSPRAQ